jgi:hypothetical protein
MSKKGQIYCVILNKWFNHNHGDKCLHLIENKHGNDKCDFKFGTLFSNKAMSDTCKNWNIGKKNDKKPKRNYLPDDLFEI